MRFIVSSILLVVMFVAQAQEEPQPPQESQAPRDSVPFEVRKQAVLYNLARKYNDLEMQKTALYNLYVYNPSPAFLDSLALLYYDQQQYISAGLVAQDAATINPDDMLATEIAAVSFDNIGVSAKAIDFYEKLYVQTEQLSTLYRIMFLQYNLERYEESVTNADIILGHPDAETTNLYFPVNDQQNQLINMEVAAYRMKGMIEQAKGNNDVAAELFNKALELAPTFELLKKQIAELEKGE